jgi:hypothetical protein
MQMRDGYQLAWAGLACLLSFNQIPNADARDLYWQGQRDDIWHHGVDASTGLSNWYTSATGGIASRPPNGGDDTVFPRPSTNVPIQITREFEEVGGMGFDDEGADTTARYKFRVSTIFTLVGRGVVSGNKHPPPEFVVMGNAAIILQNRAQISGQNLATAAVIRIRQTGLLRFEGNSTARDAEVINSGGIVDFNDSASPDGAIITNRSTESGQRSSVRFYPGSTATALRVINEDTALLDFANLGFVYTRPMWINNKGTLLLGKTHLRLMSSFKQRSPGILYIDHGNNGEHGMLSSEDSYVDLGGKLVLTRFHELGPGTYTIIKAKFGIRGKFAEVDAFGGRVAYGANRVVFIKDPPP